MALTIVAHPAKVVQPPVTRQCSFQLTFTGTYATPGEPVTAALLGMSVFYNVQATHGVFTHRPAIIPTTPASDGSYTAFSVAWAVETTGVELANGAYPAGVTASQVYLLVVGR